MTKGNQQRRRISNSIPKSGEKNKKMWVEGVGKWWGSHVTCCWGRELNIANDTPEQSEQLIEDKLRKRMTKESKQGRRISNLIPKRSEKNKKGESKELENGEEVMIEHVKKRNWI